MTQTRTAFNDMLGKGWDSAKQESFCIQRAVENDPQFWWVWIVLDRFGHASNWGKPKRDENGRYTGPFKGLRDSEKSKGREAALQGRILTLAMMFPVEHKENAEQLIELAKILDQDQ